jgi:hypothetical protein
LASKCIALRSICRNILPPNLAIGCYHGSPLLYQFYPGKPSQTVQFTALAHEVWRPPRFV